MDETLVETSPEAVANSEIFASDALGATYPSDVLSEIDYSSDIAPTPLSPSTLPDEPAGFDFGSMFKTVAKIGGTALGSAVAARIAPSPAGQPTYTSSYRAGSGPTSLPRRMFGIFSGGTSGGGAIGTLQQTPSLIMYGIILIIGGLIFFRIAR